MNTEPLKQLWAKLVQLKPHVLKFTAAILLIIAVVLALFDRIAAGSLVAALFIVVALFHFRLPTPAAAGSYRHHIIQWRCRMGLARCPT
jgi:lysylphosphatidylglycerol synthetase-like protein (DUF2156 family)